MNGPLLSVRGLTVRYGAIEALHGIDLDVPEGRIVTLIGSNGAGKTTTLRTISGLLRASAGSVAFAGEEIGELAPHEIVKRGVVQAPEGRGIFPNMSVDENLALGAFTRSDSAGIAADRERSLALFPRLRERLSQSAGTLSGGEQQMLAIARALLARPRLLLLDEPSLGLAPQVVATIFRIVREINAAGTTILLVEQNARMALSVSHVGCVLEVGRIVLRDEASALAKSDSVRRAYLGGE
ncbi:MAG: ABC transporter ATP-binding protein [Holophagales bacterium]|nr:ABC transporter ATP-binding protein [Holophagales bacterium]MBK9968617.1 ABC transporter ATP-binding protein [Holophagales bacterium]